jgi:Eco29kI restriction endonuclease
MSNPPAFNPLEKHSLGESVGLALSRCPAVSLAKIPSFKGAGIYALYYTGDFAPYATLAALNRKEASVPIYVGKAVPEGSRKGVGPKASQQSSKLRARLNIHARSIKQTQTLKVEDFTCRFLVVDETWIGLCESLLIQISIPLWNAKLDGFGRNPQGKNRKDGVSPWHVFHSGRDFTSEAKPSGELLTKLAAEVAAFMADLRARIERNS